MAEVYKIPEGGTTPSVPFSIPLGGNGFRDHAKDTEELGRNSRYGR